MVSGQRKPHLCDFEVLSFTQKGDKPNWIYRFVTFSLISKCCFSFVDIAERSSSGTI